MTAETPSILRRIYAAVTALDPITPRQHTRPAPVPLFHLKALDSVIGEKHGGA